MSGILPCDMAPPLGRSARGCARLRGRGPGRAALVGVAARGLAEPAGVFAAELRGALVADAEADVGGGGGAVEEQAAGVLEAELLLVLERAEGGDALEVVVER